MDEKHQHRSLAVGDAFVELTITDRAGGSADEPRLAVARYPVTVDEYRVFIDAGGYRNGTWWSPRGAVWRDRHGVTQPAFWGQPGYDHPRLPVTGVSFWEAQAYARFSDAELPTEREWYCIASNGGSTRFPWGDTLDAKDTDIANLAFFGAFAPSRRLPVDRSAKSASAHGVCDLIGNVGEWCLPDASPTLSSNQETAVLRGGSCWHVPGVADASFRDEVPLTVRDNQTGIRLVRRIRGRHIGGRHSDVSPRLRPLGRSIARPTTPFRQEGIPPGLTEASWRLTISGEGVAQPRSFSLEELKRGLVKSSDRGLFVCVCRWGQHNQFEGVSVEDLLDACGMPVRGRELYLLQRSAPGADGRAYETTVPIAQAIANRALIAWSMDGAPLTPELGWPLRYVDLALYGYKCVKCLTELIVTAEYRPGWWERKCQYDIDGTIMPGTITIVGEDAMRFDIVRAGRVDERDVAELDTRPSANGPQHDGKERPCL